MQHLMKLINLKRNYQHNHSNVLERVHHNLLISSSSLDLVLITLAQRRCRLILAIFSIIVKLQTRDKEKTSLEYSTHRITLVILCGIIDYPMYHLTCSSIIYSQLEELIILINLWTIHALHRISDRLVISTIILIICKGQ